LANFNVVVALQRSHSPSSSSAAAKPASPAIFFTMRVLNTIAIAALLGASSISAHPGESAEALRQEIEDRAAYFKTRPRDLSHCAAKLKARGITAGAVQRRISTARQEREKRGISQSKPFLKARDADTVLATNHTSPIVYSPATDEEIIFAGNSSCVLSPETTQGPYCKLSLTSSSVF
jgi:hypothetical protein